MPKEFYGSLILRDPFQPLGISTLNVPHVFCWLCRSSQPQRKSDSDLGPSTGVAPWIPHGFSHGNGPQRVPIHLFVRIQIPTLAPLKPMKSDISYKIATWIENIPLSNELQMWNLRKNDV